MVKRIDNRSISDRLKAIGFTHRARAGENTGQEILDEEGEVVYTCACADEPMIEWMIEQEKLAYYVERG